MTDRPRWGDLRTAFERYAGGRQELLEAIGIHGSNRDPLAKFSERLVAVLLEGELAPSRVQRGWDLTAARRRVQVKYLANPAERWVNEIHIAFASTTEDRAEEFAVVFFQALLPVAVIVSRTRRSDS